ncbi:MAG: hypothetical protein H8E57_00775, partial [Candidatus Cloacimonetes bacterium]|nr:hypothetical protein [Candidatus Cloacimonadota bacterium]
MIKIVVAFLGSVIIAVAVVAGIKEDDIRIGYSIKMTQSFVCIDKFNIVIRKIIDDIFPVV